MMILICTFLMILWPVYAFVTVSYTCIYLIVNYYLKYLNESSTSFSQSQITPLTWILVGLSLWDCRADSFLQSFSADLVAGTGIHRLSLLATAKRTGQTVILDTTEKWNISHYCQTHWSDTTERRNINHYCQMQWSAGHYGHDRETKFKSLLPNAVVSRSFWTQQRQKLRQNF